LLLYAPTGQRHQIVWVDRNGAETPVSTNRAALWASGDADEAYQALARGEIVGRAIVVM
jgi:hypothetical protein